MGGITCNAEGFADETGAVDVLEGGERDTNDLLSCSHYPLKGFAAGRVAGAIPHSDAASQNALDGASVEGAHDGGRIIIQYYHIILSYYHTDNTVSMT